MRISVKTLALITILLLPGSLFAQLKRPVLPGVGADVKKVIEDYPNMFRHLMGEVVAEDPQSTDYECKLKIKGAEESFFTRYSAKKEICSWQAIMLTTENFEKAKQQFKTIFSQINNLSISSRGAQLQLKGKYENPEEEKKFSSILFSFDKEQKGWEKLKVEIILQYFAPMEWKVKVLVYDREREDNERGEVVEAGVGN